MILVRTETSAAMTAIDPNRQMHPAVRALMVVALNAAVDAQQPGLSRTDAAKNRKEAAEAAADLVAVVLALGDPASPEAVRAAAYAARLAALNAELAAHRAAIPARK